MHLGELDVLEFGPVGEEELGFLGLPIVEVVANGTAIHDVGHDPGRIVLRTACDVEFAVRDLAENLEVLLDGLV